MGEELQRLVSDVERGQALDWRCYLMERVSYQRGVSGQVPGLLVLMGRHTVTKWRPSNVWLLSQNHRRCLIKATDANSDDGNNNHRHGLTGDAENVRVGQPSPVGPSVRYRNPGLLNPSRVVY
jgi:hypothetical protein